MNFQECPIGTYKNVEGSDAHLCTPCSLDLLPNRANFIYVRGIFDECDMVLHARISVLSKFLGLSASFQGGLLNHHVHINVYLISIGCQIAIPL